MIFELCCALTLSVAPSDTLKVSVDEAEALFAKRNLTALASQYQIDVARAFEIQAKLYPNPTIASELNMVDPQNKEYFHTGKDGQKYFSVDQVIVLGGKRKSEIAMSRQNTAISTLEFEELLRQLYLELHSNLIDVYFNERVVAKFNQQLTLLDSIIASYERQALKGNIPYKEVIRLKSVYIRINNEKTTFLLDILDQQKKLQVLLQTQSYVVPQFDLTTWSKFQEPHPADSLIEMALQRRPDYKISQSNINYANLNLKYQRQLAVPNLNVGAAYDQRGGAFNNQVGLTLSMPLPLTNRNQGNIKAAEHQAKIAEVQSNQSKSIVETEVLNAWKAFDRSITEYTRARQMYNADFDSVFRGVSENFQRRNITLLEFVDFFESYNETLVQINHIERQVALSAEQLNYSVAYPVYK